ncbi:HTH-type transcriptional regulator LeuO [Buttiauxella agrestis]|uniref:HTH-type transcriptional regulator LeuO n=1 Tax=Buttiauxella agrestis TaxID=82977 RepID=A0A381KNI3_9ENTR|nr:LysR substrate-binding domain-containing protein [Buttiauxella agrestis]SUY92920.1 HTH-type transcriptional regulator LeuO [Buttiauxella agrestis]
MIYDSIINNFEKINSFDFNLLFIFETIFIYSSVSIAADKLESSPSSISQSLNKLRTYFSDPLFIRKGQGLVPTTVAIHLHEKISNELGWLVNSLVNTSNINTRNKFTVYSLPYTAQIVLPKICALIHKLKLPYELTHISANVSLNESEDILNYRKADLIFDTKPHYGNSTVTVLYMRENIVVVCNKDHPRLDKELTQEDIRREKFTYININTQGLKHAQDIVQDYESGRHIFFSSSSVEVNAAVTETTECVSFVSESFFKKFGECFNLKSLKYEIPIEPINFYMSYNKSALSNENFLRLINLLKENIPPELK